jgi:hypothetical protein
MAVLRARARTASTLPAPSKAAPSAPRPHATPATSQPIALSADHSPAPWNARATTTATLVDRLEANGLLRREPVPEDGRGSYVVITEEGAATLRRMWPVYRRHIREDFLDPLGAGAWRLKTALERTLEKNRAMTPS